MNTDTHRLKPSVFIRGLYSYFEIEVLATESESIAIDTASLLAISSELFNNRSIIILPESANYNCQETL